MDEGGSRQQETSLEFQTNWMLTSVRGFTPRFNGKTLTVIGLAGVAAPYLIYNGCVNEFVSFSTKRFCASLFLTPSVAQKRKDEHDGAPQRKFW